MQEASMDWASFIASVPGWNVVPLETEYYYQTSTIKNSLYRYGAGSLEASFLSFERWCKAHTEVPISKRTGVPVLKHTAGAFYEAVNDWRAEDKDSLKIHTAITHRVCADERGQLVAAMLVRQEYGFAHAPINEDKLRAPVISFYTPEQADQFIDFHKARRAETIKEANLAMQKLRDQQNEKSRRLRVSPKIGDKTDKGLIIDLRPPLALIQYDPVHQLMSLGAQSNWVAINELVAPP